MRVEFVPAARHVLRLSWAARLGTLAAIFQGLAEFQDQLPGIQAYVPHGTFATLSIACAIAVPMSRIIKQQAITDAVANEQQQKQGDQS